MHTVSETTGMPVAETAGQTPNTAELLAIYQLIKAHPDEWYQFDFGRQTACATAYCFAGWAAVRAGASPRWGFADASGAAKFSAVDTPEDVVEWADDYAADVLGLDLHTEASRLFDPHNTLADLRRVITEITGVDPEAAPVVSQ